MLIVNSHKWLYIGVYKKFTITAALMTKYLYLTIIAASDILLITIMI